MDGTLTSTETNDHKSRSCSTETDAVDGLHISTKMNDAYVKPRSC